MIDRLIGLIANILFYIRNPIIIISLIFLLLLQFFIESLSFIFSFHDFVISNLKLLFNFTFLFKYSVHRWGCTGGSIYLRLVPYGRTNKEKRKTLVWIYNIYVCFNRGDFHCYGTPERCHERSQQTKESTVKKTKNLHSFFPTVHPYVRTFCSLFACFACNLSTFSNFHLIINRKKSFELFILGIFYYSSY